MACLRTIRFIGACLLLPLFCVTTVRALEPDAIALIVNRNAPESADLAKFYARARNVPGDRIIQLDLPVGVDEIPFEDYDRLVAQPVRQFLQAHGLQQQVQCLVTFHGVPLRVAKRAVTPRETAELEEVRREHTRVQQRLVEAVASMERLAGSVDPSFQPLQLATPDALARRADHASRTVTSSLEKIEDADRRQQVQRGFDAVTQTLSTPIGDAPTTAPGMQEQRQAPAPEPVDPQALQRLLQHPDDPAARDALRALARRSANPFAYERVLHEQASRLNPEHTDSAIDSELALLLAGPYPRAGWQLNPLGYPFINMPGRPHVLMVMRLDAPTPQQVRQMIQTSISVEQEGLKGTFVIDSRGIAVRQADGSPDAFGAFDQRMRELATIVKDSTELPLVFDEQPDVLSAETPIDDVALYCGWYSVGQYVPGMKFASGAVGYHIASYELTSLRDETNTGWGRGLINDGVVATVGPVSEPLLHAFPAPDDFFPLLLTGKLTLAEVYWRTNPLTSWKMCAIGDPLYTPFRQNPAIQPDQLPERLRPLFSDDAPIGAPPPPRP